MAAHRYWRINILKGWDTTYIGYAEVELRDTVGGPDLTGSGTPIGTEWTSVPSEYPQYAYDNVNTTRWQFHRSVSQTSGSQATGWIGYDFGAGNEKDIIEVNVKNLHDTGGRNLRFALVEYSDDGTTWVPYWAIIENTSLGAGVAKTYTRPADSDAFTRWGMLCNKVIGAGTFPFSSTELIFRDDLGTDLASGGTASSPTGNTSGNPANLAFDRNTATFFIGPQAVGAPMALLYQHTASVTPVEYSFRARNDSFGPNESPKDWYIIGSDNGVEWLVKDIRKDEPAWTAGELRTYSLESEPIYPPTILYLTPTEGPSIGGTSVILSGMNFTGSTGAALNGQAVGDFTVLDDFTITFTTPQSTVSGFVDLELFNPNGDDDLPYAFEYLPSIHLVSPDEGPAEGGTSVTITGTGFIGTTEARFGGIAATDLMVVDDNTITCTTPATSMLVGLVDVEVDAPSGTIEAPYSFDYFSCRILYITPDFGDTGETVVITGIGFSDATGVLVNGIAADNFTIIDGHEIRFDAPDQGEGFSGFVDIIVQHPLGDAELAYGFEYLSPQAHITQIPINIVELHSEPARVTQIALNVIYVPQKPGSITQIPINAIFPFETIAPDALIPQWPVKETWSWKTSLVKTYSGREQRMAARREPWQSFEYNLAIFDDADRQTALHTLWRQIGRPMNYPLFVYRTTVDTLASIGDMFLDVDLSSGNFRESEPVAVFNADLSFYHVLSTSGFGSPGGISLELPLGVDVPAGTMIAPAPACRIDDANSFSMDLHTGAAPITFTAAATRGLLRPDQTATVDTFDGMPILMERHIADTPEEVIKNLESLANDISLPRDYTTWYFPQVNTVRSYVSDRDDLDFWREFGDTIKGSRGTFLVPTFRDDFSLSSTPALGASVLQTDDEYVSDYMKSRSMKYLRIETQNGVIYRKVADVRLNMDRTATITLANALGGSAGDNVIRKLSIVYKVRLSDDRIILNHMPNHVEVMLNVSTVEQ